MKIHLVLAAAVLAVAGSFQASRAECLPKGQCKTVCKEFVAGPDAVLTGSLFESDREGPDDNMGDVSFSNLGGGKWLACATVCNEGGSLKGPDGQAENGGSEGDCIEVFIDVDVGIGAGTSGAYIPPYGAIAQAVVASMNIQSQTFWLCDC